MVTPPKYVLPIYKSVALLALVALSSTASQATLSPSHGSFPAAIYHTRIIAAIIVLAAPADYLFKLVLPRSIRGKSAFLPFISACIPMTQLALLPSARTIGAMGSAALIEFLTIGPLLALTLNVTWKSFQASNPQNEDLAGEPVVAMVISTVLYVALQVISAYALPSLIGLALPLTRSFLPILLSVVTAAVIPSKVALLAALPILHTVLLNPHTPFARPTAILNSTISIDGFSLVTREESLTGYLSVLENTQKGFRVMRCDHSLLGGEWVFGKGDWPGGVSGEFKRGVVGEPIYTVFIMLEAIRLVQDSNGMLEPELWENGTMLDGPMIPDKDASALVM